VVVASLSGHHHPPGQHGTLDESGRRVPWEELSVATILVAEGHHVRAWPERGGRGRRPDFEVCGVKTEVKTLDRGATAQTVANAVRRGQAQGEVVIINASCSGLSLRQAEAGVHRFVGSGPLGRVSEVRVLGAGFSLSFPRAALEQLVGGRRSERGVGL
jgi:Contact-dependent growth inhibition CdiA C-terminal domain